MAKVGSESSGGACPTPQPDPPEGNIFTIPTCFYHMPRPLDMKRPQELYQIGMDNPAYYSSEVGLTIPPHPQKKPLKKTRDSAVPERATLEKHPCLRLWKLHFKTKEASRYRRTVALFLALIVLLIVLIVGIALAVYISVGGDLNWGGPRSSPAEEGSWAVEGEFRVTNRDYTMDMNDHTSVAFLRMAAEVTKSMDELFVMSSLVRDYNGTEIIGFSKGSVIVNCRIFLNHPFIKAAEQVGLTFVQTLEQGHGMLPTGSLHVDITSIRFAGLHGITAPPVDLKPITLPPTDAAWSPWGQWSSCKDLGGKCDPNRIHSRSRDCRTDFGRGMRLHSNEPCKRQGSYEIEILDCVCFPTQTSSSSSTMTPTRPSLVSSKSVPESTNVTDEAELWTVRSEAASNGTAEPSDGPCGLCQHDGICLFSVGALTPRCVTPVDPQDPRGCGGWCAGPQELCRQLNDHLYQCVDISECHSAEWRCGDGLCIPAKRRCDGHFNCYDMSDEADCACKADEFHCGNDTSCLPTSRKCNGYIDCWDGSDEINCTTMCPNSQFTCNNGQCIPSDYFCDSYDDCDDKSDEPEQCRAPCLTHQQQCHNGRCIGRDAWCDGVDTCGDNSDEQYCPLSTTDVVET